jgi:hypothetical protein
LCTARAADKDPTRDNAPPSLCSALPLPWQQKQRT